MIIWHLDSAGASNATLVNDVIRMPGSLLTIGRIWLSLHDVGNFHSHRHRCTDILHEKSPPAISHKHQGPRRNHKVHHCCLIFSMRSQIPFSAQAWRTNMPGEDQSDTMPLAGYLSAS